MGERGQRGGKGKTGMVEGGKKRKRIRAFLGDWLEKQMRVYVGVRADMWQIECPVFQGLTLTPSMARITQRAVLILPERFQRTFSTDFQGALCPDVLSVPTFSEDLLSSHDVWATLLDSEDIAVRRYKTLLFLELITQQSSLLQNQ